MPDFVWRRSKQSFILSPCPQSALPVYACVCVCVCVCISLCSSHRQRADRETQRSNCLCFIESWPHILHGVTGWGLHTSSDAQKHPKHSKIWANKEMGAEGKVCRDKAITTHFLWVLSDDLDVLSLYAPLHCLLFRKMLHSMPSKCFQLQFRNVTNKAETLKEVFRAHLFPWTWEAQKAKL